MRGLKSLSIVLSMLLQGALSLADMSAVGLNDLIQEHHVDNFSFEVVNDNGFFPKDHYFPSQGVSRILFFRGHIFAPDIGSSKQQDTYYSVKEHNLILKDYTSESFRLYNNKSGTDHFLTLNKREYMNETVCSLDIKTPGVDHGEYFWTVDGEKPFTISMVGRNDRAVKNHRRSLEHVISNEKDHCPDLRGMPEGQKNQFSIARMLLKYTNLQGKEETAMLTCQRLWTYFAIYDSQKPNSVPVTKGGMTYDADLIRTHGCGNRLMTVGDIATALNGLRPNETRYGSRFYRYGECERNERGRKIHRECSDKGLKRSFLRFDRWDWKVGIGPAAEHQSRR